MARGYPALWSLLLGAPFVGSGAYIYLTDPSTAVPETVGLPVLAFGTFVVAVGVYIQYVAAPAPPTMRDSERVIETRNPSQRAATAKVAVGFVFLALAAYLLFATFMPYVYPTVTFVVGLFLFSTGLHTYWTNTLTTYYVTDHRLIKEYRFVSLVRQELPFEKVRGVTERKSIWEALVGLGSVRVASGGGATLEIVIENIYTSTEFADEIRTLL